MQGTGQYRCRGANDQSHTAFVNDKSISFDIGERLYRWRGYVPDFDQLPWVEMGEARPARQSVGNKPGGKALGEARVGYREGTFDQTKQSNAS